MGWFDRLFGRKQKTLDEGDIGTGAAAASWTAMDDADDSGADDSGAGDAGSGGGHSGGSGGGGFDAGGGGGSDGGSSG